MGEWGWWVNTDGVMHALGIYAYHQGQNQWWAEQKQPFSRPSTYGEGWIIQYPLRASLLLKTQYATGPAGTYP